MLILPTEAADSGLAGGFDHRDIKNLTADFVMAFLALLPGEVEESLIGNGFDETIP